MKVPTCWRNVHTWARSAITGILIIWKDIMDRYIRSTTSQKTAMKCPTVPMTIAFYSRYARYLSTPLVLLILLTLILLGRTYGLCGKKDRRRRHCVCEGVLWTCEEDSQILQRGHRDGYVTFLVDKYAAGDLKVDEDEGAKFKQRESSVWASAHISLTRRWFVWLAEFELCCTLNDCRLSSFFVR